jgi:hypothetical protein
MDNFNSTEHWKTKDKEWSPALKRAGFKGHQLLSLNKDTR